VQSLGNHSHIEHDEVTFPQQCQEVDLPLAVYVHPYGSALGIAPCVAVLKHSIRVPLVCSQTA